MVTVDISGPENQSTFQILFLSMSQQKYKGAIDKLQSVLNMSKI